MSSYPYVPNSTVFNTNDYNILNEGLTIETANKLYLSINDGRYITGITEGVAQPSKALVLNSALNIAGINDISSSFIETKNTSTTLITNSLLGASYGLHLHAQLTSSNGKLVGSGIAFNNQSTDGVPLANICLDKISSGVGDLCFHTRNGSNCDEVIRLRGNGNLKFTGGNKRIEDISIIDFNLDSLLYKSIMRKSTVGAGIEFYDTQFSSSTMAILSFVCGNATSNYTALKLYQPYNVNDTAGTAFGQSFQLGQRNGPSFGGGFTICTTATASYSEQDRINLAVNGGATPYLTLNPKFNQLHLFPQGLAELNTTYTENVIIGEDLKIRKHLRVDGYIQIGTSTDTNRLISALDSSMTAGDSAFITLGQNNTSKNQAELSFYYAGNGSNSNRLDFGFFGGSVMFLTAQGRLGVGTSSPRAPLEVSAAVGSIQIIPIGTITYGYNVSNNVWTNYGGGPITIPSLSGIFNGNIYVAQNVFTTSDRRLKKNIKEIDLDIDNYKKLKPVSYKYKSDDRQQIGLIAQDVLKVCSEAITFTENPNMKVDVEGDDLDGIQLGMDYKIITVLNVDIIKKLITRVEALEARLKKK